MKVIAHQCPHCPRIFITEQGMKAHKRTCKYRQSCKTCDYYRFDGNTDDYGGEGHVCDHDEAINIHEIGCQYDCQFYKMRQSHVQLMAKAKYAKPLEVQS